MADPQLVPVDHDPWANADREPFTADQIALPPPSAAGTVGPNAASAVGRAVGGAAIAPLWDAGQYVGGLLHGNEEWDSARATQLGGNLALNFLPFGRAAALAKGGADVAENMAPRLAMDEASRMARARAMGYTTDAYHGTASLDVDRPAATEFNQFKISPDDIGIHFGTPEQAAERLDMHDVGAFERIYPAKLKLQNPLRLDDPIEWTPTELAGQLSRGAAPNISKQDVLDVLAKHANSDNAETLTGFRDLLQSKGYDGIVYKNAVEGAKAVEGQQGALLRGRAEKIDALKHALIDSRDSTPEQIYTVEKEHRAALQDYNSHILKNAKDSYIVFNPNQVRSRFAKFDPAQASSGDIMRAAIPIAGAGTANSQWSAVPVDHDPFAQ